MKTAAGLFALLMIAACAPVPMDPRRAAEICEEKARAAQGPTGEVSVGINSSDGPFADASIGITSDYIAGRDPMVVYERCVVAKTGQGPIRPPALR